MPARKVTVVVDLRGGCDKDDVVAMSFAPNAFTRCRG